MLGSESLVPSAPLRPYSNVSMNEKNLILIPARSGSTRVKNKNLRELAGKPLLAYVTETAVRSNSGRVIVSTDSENIAAVAESYGAEVPFLRPNELSTETSTSISVIVHALLWLAENNEPFPEFIAFCPPTNPLVRPETIRAMFKKLAKRGDRNSIVTVAQPLSHPFTVVQVNDGEDLEVGVLRIGGKSILDFERSQDWPRVYEGSAACRLTRTQYFLERITSADNPYEIEGRTYDVSSCLGFQISAREATDIDTEEDLNYAEFLLFPERPTDSSV